MYTVGEGGDTSTWRTFLRKLSEVELNNESSSTLLGCDDHMLEDLWKCRMSEQNSKTDGS